MKLFRFWLLIVLAVMLPLRGAMAGAMLCAPAGSGIQSEAIVAGHDAGGHHDVFDAAAHDHARGDHSVHHGHESGGGLLVSPDSCNFCSAYCSLTPIVSSLPTLVAPNDLAAAAFPELRARVASFLSDGQERPPRSI